MIFGNDSPYWKARHPYHGTCRARPIDLDALRERAGPPPAILKLPDVARTATALARRAREAGLTESALALEVAALAVKTYLDVGSERIDSGERPSRIQDC
jgi:hypothetical protein